MVTQPNPTPPVGEADLMRAKEIAIEVGAGLTIGAAEVIARALLSEREAATLRERERCETVARDYATGVKGWPDTLAGEKIARRATAFSIAASIRAPSP